MKLLAFETATEACSVARTQRVQDVQGFFGAAISDDQAVAPRPPGDDWFADARF